MLVSEVYKPIDKDTYKNRLNLPSRVVKNLHDWTYNGLHVLTSEDIEILLQKAPYKGGRVYRGMNFRTAEAAHDFMKQTHNGKIYVSKSWSSWTPSQEEAYAYAITWPTYHLNYDLMHAEDQKSRNRDHMIGYLGVILSIDLALGQGIDLSLTGYAHEHEIIVTAGQYPMSIVQEYRPFKQSITTQDEANTQLMQIKSLTLGDNESFDSKKFSYIMHNFAELSDAARDHLGKLIPIPEKPYAKVKTQHWGWSGKDQLDLDIDDNIFPIMVAYYPLLTPKYQARIKRFVDTVMRLKIQKVQEYFQENPNIDWSKTRLTDRSKDFEEVVNPKLMVKFRKIFRSGIATKYHQMADLVSQINKIKDPNKQRQMVDDYMEQVKRLVANMATI